MPKALPEVETDKVQAVKDHFTGRASGGFGLDSIRKGIRPAPDRILVIGVEGVGKTTFGSEAPSPVFVAAEDGVRHLDVQSFPEPESFSDVLKMLETLGTQKHPYKTLVVDTLDWIMPLIQRTTMDRMGWDFADYDDYGRGYKASLDEWGRLLGAFDYLRNNADMEIILLAHTQIKRFSNPGGEDYDRYEGKLDKQSYALVKEWVDTILFAHFDEKIRPQKGMSKAKGVFTGRRVLHTVRTAAWDGKNRYGLPETLPLSYAEYATARSAHTPASASDLMKEARELLKGVENKKKRLEINQYLTQNEGNASELVKAVNRLRVLTENTQED